MRDRIRGSRSFFLCLFFAAVLLGASACSNSSPGGSGKATGIRGGETRATLSPTHFTGAAARAYQIAAEIPEVIDSLHCYCECKENLGHKSLLTCYVDGHASNCGICIDEAFMGYELYKQGKDPASIRKAVDQRYSSYGR